MFGVGVWRSAGRRSRLRVVGSALLAQCLIDIFWPPMHLRGTEPTLTDALHIAFAMAWLLLMLIAVGVGATVFGRSFRRYSAVTVAILVAFGLLSATRQGRAHAERVRADF